MKDSMTKLRIAVQTEASLLRLRTRQAFQNLALLASASICVLMAVSVLNYAAFEALNDRFGHIVAGLVIGGLDLCAALVLMRAALSEAAETEEERLAQTVRDLTYSSLGDDVDELRSELRSFVEDVRRLQSTVGEVTSGISSTVGMAMDFAHFVKRKPQSTTDPEPSDAS